MKLVKILIVILAAVGIVILFFYSQKDLAGFYSKISLNLPQIEKGISNLVQEAGKQILTPPPLKAEKEALNAFLTQAGVIRLTNTERAKAGLSALKESQLLDASAAAKVSDMFKNQYFAHISPSGLGVGDLAENEGYDYLVIGENLALGNFENDQVLIQAWMDSPGHRANILNANYQEIGVSVQKGTYEGKTTWIAVQHFGKPLSACPQPNEAKKAAIENNQKQITELQNTLDLLNIELQTMSRHDKAYNEKVNEYNNLVSQYNNLLAETKELVAEYNKQVKALNSCASGN
jgi:uncharacterized protein YkwD